MARVEQSKCNTCGSVYAYVHQPHVWRREDICEPCKAKTHSAKVMALKHELAQLTKSPILMLLAEVTVLRDTLVRSGKIDEVAHFTAVIQAVKEMTGFIDGKADQTGHQPPTGHQDPPG